MDRETKKQIKHVLHSKTIWINVIALVAIVTQKHLGFELSPDLQMELLTVVNIILRLVTHEKITWSKNGNSQENT